MINGVKCINGSPVKSLIGYNSDEIEGVLYETTTKIILKKDKITVNDILMKKRGHIILPSFSKNTF